MKEAMVDQTADAVRALATAFDEPQWLLRWREAAWQQRQSGPRPDRVTHLWRYTDPKHFEPAEPWVATRGTKVTVPAHAAEGLQRGELSAVAAVGPGGAFAAQLSAEATRAGVVVLDLHQAARHDDFGPRVQEQLGRLVPASHGRFEASNAALWTGGLFVHVPRGVRLTQPVHLVFEADGRAPHHVPRVLVEVGEQSEVGLVEEHLGGGSKLVSHAVSEVVVGPSARVRYVLAQRLGAEVKHHGTQRLELARDAEAVVLLTSFGGAVAKLDNGVILNGRGSRARVRGFLYGEKRQHFDHHTVLDHRADHTNSDLDFKAVLADHSRSAYTGVIRIPEQAPYSEAYQENRNLLLSDHARAESIPELEISIDEVQCKHGATVGPVDPHQLFYLMSRGIPEIEAVRVIVKGFFEPTLRALPEDLADPMRRELDARLAQL